MPRSGKPILKIEWEIAASDDLVDLATGGFDAGIRLGRFIAHDMMTVRLTPPFPFVAVGGPDYLERHGRPERVDKLDHHASLHVRRSNGGSAMVQTTLDDVAEAAHGIAVIRIEIGRFRMLLDGARRVL